MAFKPNYNLQRSDRNRTVRARSEEKQRKKDEKTAQRKAERTVEIESPCKAEGEDYSVIHSAKNQQ
jgi:hypothetical protein